MPLPVARVELVDHLPGGLPLVPLQRDGELVIRAQKKDMPEHTAEAAEHALQYMLDTGSITLNWPPSQAREPDGPHPN